MEKQVSKNGLDTDWNQIYLCGCDVHPGVLWILCWIQDKQHPELSYVDLNMISLLVNRILM